MSKKEIYLLLGPAAIGKTSWIKSVGFPKNSLAVISRDEVVKEVSAKYNLSFDDLYHFPPHDSTIGEFISGYEKYGKVIESPSIVKHLQPFSYQYLDSINAEINFMFYNQFQYAVRNPDIAYIVIDRVHLRKKERMEYLKMLPSDRNNFYISAVLFNFQDPDALNVISKMSEIRTKQMKAAGERYRTVPRSVQQNMIKFYEPIEDSEGYDSIQHVDTLPNLRSAIIKEYFNVGFDESGKCPYCGFEMISLNPIPADFTDRYRHHDHTTDTCVSCKKEFVVYEMKEDLFNPEEPFTRYHTEKINK